MTAGKARAGMHSIVTIKIAILILTPLFDDEILLLMQS
jgi:hypothetical protein